jgi:hypothetical protein
MISFVYQIFDRTDNRIMGAIVPEMLPPPCGEQQPDEISGSVGSVESDACVIRSILFLKSSRPNTNS